MLAYPRGVRRSATLIAAGVLMVGPTVLAFFSGGYFDKARLIAAIVACLLVAVAAVASPKPLPASRPGRAALAGMAVLSAWTGLSLLWAPLAGPASDDFQRTLLYLATIVAAAALLRSTPVSRAVEPGLAGGVLVVIGYGLAGRLMPGLVELDAAPRANGRLEQPLTYWNAEGALAAMGLVLCARLVGDSDRPAWIRALGAAACAPLGGGLYLSLSRGAMAAGAVGLCVLLALAPTRSQLRGLAIAASAAIAGAASSSLFSGFESLAGSLDERQADGAAMLAILSLLAAAAGWASVVVSRREQAGRLPPTRLAWAARLPAVAAALVALTFAGLVAGGLRESGEVEIIGANQSERLASLESRRYDYWRVAAEAATGRPMTGEGAGAFRVIWLRERPVSEAAADAHSLPLETALELGIVGLLGLGLLIGGVGAAAVRALAQQPGSLAGAAAAAVVWLLHSTIDWDWEMPAVTLPALVIAGALIAASEPPPRIENRSAAGARV
jgi:hypothetical protein